MNYGARDRRSGFGPGSSKDLDIESLERDNDKGIESLSEKISLLKNATTSIRNEVDSQNTLLDRMEGSMLSTRGMLSGAVDRFKVVMSDKQNSKMFTIVMGTVFVLLLLYYLTRR